MKNIIAVMFFIVFGILFYSFADDSKPQPIRNTLSDSLELDRMKYVNQVLEKIKGKENLPVDSVFQNLKIFTGLPAKNLLGIMNFGYSKSLGVS